MRYLLPIVVCFSSVAIFAQTRPPTSGEITFNSTETKRATYSDQVRSTAEFFESFAALQAAAGTGGAVGTLSRDSLFYLTGLYLYCIQRSGVCRLVPDALYEVELVRSLRKSPDSCSSLPKFWQLWTEQGMEERVRYVVPMASIKALADYNQRERPKLLKCAASTAEDLKGASAAFLKERYARDARLAALGKSLAQVIRQLEEKNVNVFSATGSAAPADSTAGSMNKSTRRSD